MCNFLLKNIRPKTKRRGNENKKFKNECASITVNGQPLDMKLATDEKSEKKSQQKLETSRVRKSPA